MKQVSLSQLYGCAFSCQDQRVFGNETRHITCEFEHAFLSPDSDKTDAVSINSGITSEAGSSYSLTSQLGQECGDAPNMIHLTSNGSDTNLLSVAPLPGVSYVFDETLAVQKIPLPDALTIDLRNLPQKAEKATFIQVDNAIENVSIVLPNNRRYTLADLNDPVIGEQLRKELRETYNLTIKRPGQPNDK